MQSDILSGMNTARILLSVCLLTLKITAEIFYNIGPVFGPLYNSFSFSFQYSYYAIFCCCCCC